MENKIKIRKVHLLSLMTILADIHNRGVDFVDVYGTIENGQDTIGLSFSKDYMNQEYTGNFDTMMEEDRFPSKVDIKLSDEDLNQLI